MKTITEYLNRNSFDKKLGCIIFQLDESSIELLDDEFQQFIIEGKDYRHHGNRIVWTSNDGDNLRMGNHATQRQDRPVEKGGDGGKRISQAEIINMFKWAWDDIIEMYYDGKLDHFEHNQRIVDAWTIECQCWLNDNNGQIEYAGARPRNMNLWAVWLLEEDGYKIDITIKTIYRGERMNHVAVQERIRIDTKGKVKQLYRI